MQSSIVYQGFMEDIVMGGLSERGQTYSQDDFLKIYNLDFCNNISTPRKIRDLKGKITYYYKLQVIDKLLKYQQHSAIAKKGSKFIMYLTINSNTFEADVSKISFQIYKHYFKHLASLKKKEVSDVRMLKAYCFHEMTNLFNKYNFNIEFLPPIFYLGSSYPNQNRGSKNQFHRMMTFTILGTYNQNNEPMFQQDIGAFLNAKFLFANGKNLQCFTDKFISEQDFTPSSISLLEESFTYKNLWK